MNHEIFKFQCRCFNFFNILKFTIGNLDEVIEVVSGNKFIYLFIYLLIYFASIFKFDLNFMAFDIFFRKLRLVDFQI